jgi:hypothetical protein
MKKVEKKQKREEIQKDGSEKKRLQRKRIMKNANDQTCKLEQIREAESSRKGKTRSWDYTAL